MTFSTIAQRVALLFELSRREVLTRYRGSLLGTLWSLVTPLFMLTVFTFVFGTVFRVRWGPTTNLPHAQLALLLFSGLVVFNMFSESVLQAPTSVTRNVNYVKRIVFPLELLPLVYIAAALYHGIVSLAVLLVGRAIFMGGLPLTAFLVPVVLLPLLIATTGVCLFLGSIGVFLRDASQTVGLLVTALMFLSPIFYPISALPEKAQHWIRLNPLSGPIEDFRAVLLMGTQPDWPGFLISLGVSMIVASIGVFVFQRTRRSFADVI